MKEKTTTTTAVALASEQQAALKRLGILTISDLLYHFPVRHIDAGKSSPIEFAVEGE